MRKIEIPPGPEWYRSTKESRAVRAEWRCSTAELDVHWQLGWDADRMARPVARCEVPRPNLGILVQSISITDRSGEYFDHCLVRLAWGKSTYVLSPVWLLVVDQLEGWAFHRQLGMPLLFASEENVGGKVAIELQLLEGLRRPVLNGMCPDLDINLQGQAILKGIPWELQMLR